MSSVATQNSEKKRTPAQAAESLAAALGFLEHVLDDPETVEGATLNSDDAMGLSAIMGDLKEDAYLLWGFVQEQCPAG